MHLPTGHIGGEANEEMRSHGPDSGAAQRGQATGGPRELWALRGVRGVCVGCEGVGNRSGTGKAKACPGATAAPIAALKKAQAGQKWLPGISATAAVTNSNPWCVSHRGGAAAAHGWPIPANANIAR